MGLAINLTINKIEVYENISKTLEDVRSTTARKKRMDELFYNNIIHLLLPTGEQGDRGTFDDHRKNTTPQTRSQYIPTRNVGFRRERQRGADIVRFLIIEIVKQI